MMTFVLPDEGGDVKSAAASTRPRLSSGRRGLGPGLAVAVAALGLIISISARGRVWASAVTQHSAWSTRLLGLVAIGAVGLLWAAVVTRVFVDVRLHRWLRLGRSAAFIGATSAAALALALLVIGRSDQWFSDNGCCGLRYVPGQFDSARAAPSPTPRGVGGAGHAVGISPVWDWLVAGFLVALLALAAMLYWYRRQRRLVDDAEDPPATIVSAALDESLDDLRTEPDPRRAVIACYARMERTFQGLGLGREPSEAPFEYLERMLARSRAGKNAAGNLTRSFEKAKFSQHEVGERARDEAIEALLLLRGDLRLQP